ncbi:hypothetical protein SAFG77S_11614 [Streptomyces afghaniensis]
MKNNVIRYVENRYDMFDFDFGGLLSIILDQQYDSAKPICKSARVDQEGKYYDDEYFLNKGGEIICGIFATSFKECEEFDGEITVYREIYITTSGECLVLYATYKKTNGPIDGEEHSRICRFFPIDQSLSDEEKWEAINELLYKHYNG